MVPYPYQSDDEIGGDSVRSIEHRFLAVKENPSLRDIQIARIDAEDQFEVKVQIIHKMAVLDPTGDWLGRGARALDNLRTATGEESLERLYSFLEDLNRAGVQSPTFASLRSKVFRRGNIDIDDDSVA